jgi:cyclic pyranopterin phosphate synthase
MPAEGINFLHSDKLLTISELCRLSKILVGQGVDKIRITGGEPFVRKDLMILLRHLSGMADLKDISITTNATLIGPYIKELKQLGIRNINLSLDAIRRETFMKITRRDQYDTVFENLHRLISEDFNLRINFIVLDGQNIEDILPVMELQKKYPVSVRFLEEMPFNGGSRQFDSIHWNYKKILEYIGRHYPDYKRLESPPTSTSINYKIEGHKGSFGIIPSFSRTFCGSCNRLRISASGDIITCLYGRPVLNLRDLLRGQNSTSAVKSAILEAVGSRAKTGFEAQNQYKSIFETSMTSIGG